MSLHMTIMEMVPNLNEIPENRYDWSEMAQGIALASFYFGYIISYVPGECLPYYVGPRTIIGVGILIASISTIVIPVFQPSCYCK